GHGGDGRPIAPADPLPHLLRVINLAGGRERGQPIDFDRLGSTMLASEDSHGRAWNLKPSGDRGDQRQVGGTFSGRCRDPNLEGAAIPTMPRAARARMRPNHQAYRNGRSSACRSKGGEVADT